jgi:hypothetical protein
MKKEKIVDKNKTTSKRISQSEFFDEVINILSKPEGLKDFFNYYAFLKEREKKLIKIEQMYESGTIDLRELDDLVVGK